MKSQQRLGSAMHATFIGMYVLSWFFLDMGSRNIANKVRSSKLAWLRKRTDDLEPEQVAHAVRPLLQNYKQSLDQVTAACRLSQSLWGPMTNITMSSGAPFLLQKKKSACQSPMAFYSGSYMTATMRRRQDFFCSAVLRHCLATTVKFSWYTGSCSPLNDLNYCNMRNWANYQKLRKQSPPTKEDGTHTLDIELPRTRGARQASSKQSLPGPDSGGRRSNMTSRLLLEPTRFTKAAGSQSPVDVRVGDMDGGSYVPIFKQLQTEDVAKTGSVSQICKHIRDNGLIDRCPERGMSCNPMYISRHACKQHAWIREANAQVIQWVRNCQVPSKPCQWCGTQYATSNKAHRNACPVLWMCGHLLSKFSTLKPPGQLALHGYDWSRRADEGLGGTGILPKLHGSTDLSNTGSKSSLDRGTGGDARGHVIKKEQRGPRGPEPGFELAQKPRQGLQQAERQQRPPEVLVGKGQEPKVSRSGLGPSWGGQGLRSPSPTPGGLPCGDATRLPVHHFYAESGQEPRRECPRVERHPTALFARLSLEGPKGQEPSVTAAAVEDSFIQLVAHSDSISHRRDPDQARGQGSCNPHGTAGERLLSIPCLVSGGGEAQEGATGSVVHGGHSAGGRTAATAYHPPQRDRQVPSPAQADSRHAERRDPVDSGNPKQDAGVPDDLLGHQARGQGSCNPHGTAGERLLSIPCLVSGGGEAQEGATGSVVHGGHSAGGRTAATAYHPPQRDRQVPSPAQADSRHAERRDPVDSGNPKQDAGVPDDLPAGRKVDPKRQHTLGRFFSPTLEARQIPTGHGGGQVASGTVRPGTGILQLQLLNPHEHSYANSIVMSLLWLATCMPEGLSVPRPGLSKFLQWLSTQQKPQPLWSILTWQTVMQGPCDFPAIFA